MMRITMAILLVAGLAGCYPATPFAVRTSADKASQDEVKQRWRDMNESMTDRRIALRADARELEASKK